MIHSIKKFKSYNANMYEFIMFNLLSNIATITNFIVLNLSTNILFKSLVSRDFVFWIFDYSKANGGLGGFLAFLLSYASAQVVNFIVQRKLVFNSNNKLGSAIPIYLVTVLFVYLICLYIPTVTLGPLTNYVGSVWATNISNMFNIFVQVIIIYPVFKFVVMKKV